MTQNEQHLVSFCQCLKYIFAYDTYDEIYKYNKLWNILVHWFNHLKSVFSTTIFFKSLSIPYDDDDDDTNFVNLLSINYSVRYIIIMLCQGYNAAVFWLVNKFIIIHVNT